MPSPHDPRHAQRAPNPPERLMAAHNRPATRPPVCGKTRLCDDQDGEEAPAELMDAIGAGEGAQGRPPYAR